MARLNCPSATASVPSHDLETLTVHNIIEQDTDISLVVSTVETLEMDRAFHRNKVACHVELCRDRQHSFLI